MIILFKEGEKKYGDGRRVYILHGIFCDFRGKSLDLLVFVINPISGFISRGCYLLEAVSGDLHLGENV
jgi:hypothetical protein